MGSSSISRFATVNLEHLDPEGLERTASYSAALTVSPSAPIDDVIGQLGASHEMIVLRDDGGPVTGIITKDAFEHEDQAPGAQLRDLLIDAVKQGDELRPLREAPPLQFCEEGKHYTNACPCRDHPGSPCGG